MDELKKKAAQAIINIFETGSAQGNYASVTLLQGDSGHLTYGRAQTTLASGNLFFLIRDYCGAAGATHAAELSPYLNRLQQRDFGLDTDNAFKALLKAAGRDPVMCAIQDAFFDRVYWAPALRHWSALDFQEALSAAVVYDSIVHGSWQNMRDRTTEKIGAPKKETEKAWIKAYCETRRDWLATHTNTLLRKTVYRMDALLKLIAEKNWALDLPFRVRGVDINEDALGTDPPARVSAEERNERILANVDPPQSGDDVAELQGALLAEEMNVVVDGTFGRGTEDAVREFQRKHGLKVDGIVGVTTWAALRDRPGNVGNGRPGNSGGDRPGNASAGRPGRKKKTRPGSQ